MSPPQPHSAGPELSLVHLTRPPRTSDTVAPPLLLLLHGVGSHERDLFRFADLLDPRLLVLSVRAPLVRGPRSFAWFDVQRLPGGNFAIDAEQLRASRDRLVRFVEEATAAYAADPRRVYLLGFSQGAILSLTTALSRPRVAAGVVSLSGRIPPEARPWIAPAPELAGLPIFLAHGTLDDVIRIDHTHAARDLLRSLPVALTYREYVMPHTIGPETLRDVQTWLTARLDEPQQGGVPVMSRVRIGSIVLRVDDLPRQIAFWSAALDYVPREGDGEGDDDDFALLRPRDGVGPNLSLDRHPAADRVPPRIHLDLYTDDQAGEVNRLLALGATEVHWSKRPPDADYVILADPEGNRFCVIDTTR